MPAILQQHILRKSLIQKYETRNGDKHTHTPMMKEESIEEEDHKIHARKFAADRKIVVSCVRVGNTILYAVNHRQLHFAHTKNPKKNRKRQKKAKTTTAASI